MMNVWCWRRPNRKRCRGELVAELRHDSTEIFWECPWCGVNGVIHGWEHSLWDRRSGARRALERMNRQTRARLAPRRLRDASRKVRAESLGVSAEFAAIEPDADL